MPRIFVLVMLLLVPSKSHALTISPTLFEIELEAGATHTRTIRVYNETAASLRIHTEIAEIEIGDASGTPRFVPPKSADGLSAWITRPPALTLNPGAWLDVPVTIAVPQLAAPGSYAAALLFTPIPDHTGGAVVVVGKTGPLFLVTVPGDLHREGRIIEFAVRGAEAQNELVLSQPPTGFRVVLENTGNAYFIPQGVIVAHDTLGRMVAATELNSDERRVLPGWLRSFEPPLETDWRSRLPGRYTARLTMDLGDKEISRELTYWILPWKAIGGAGAGLASLVLIARMNRRRRV